MEMEHYYDKIYRFCYFKVNNKALAEDLTQETFLRYMQGDAREPERYLYTIARNLCIDTYRKHREISLDAMEERIPGSSDRTGREERDTGGRAEEKTLSAEGFEDRLVGNLDLQQALLKLSEEEREILVLRYVNEEAVSDICKLMGVSRFALYRRLKEASEKLRRLLERS